jgi:deoxycytidine triphosphate deaminase
MHSLSANKITEYVTDFVHKDTQLHDKRVDLTAHSIYRYNQAGSLDFGGDEFEPADTQTIEIRKNDPDDEYGWWKLGSGCYKAIFNEKIHVEEDMLAIIALHDHARQAGLMANTALLMKGDTSMLTFEISMAGCNIKENARIATAYLIYV